MIKAIKALVAKIKRIGRKQNRNRHDHELFVSIWKSSSSIEEAREGYSQFTPVTNDQTRQLFYLLQMRYKLRPLPLRKKK